MICFCARQVKREEPSNIVDYEKIDNDARVSSRSQQYTLSGKKKSSSLTCKI